MGKEAMEEVRRRLQRLVAIDGFLVIVKGMVSKVSETCEYE
jgi:hypothetical protein